MKSYRRIFLTIILIVFIFSYYFPKVFSLSCCYDSETNKILLKYDDCGSLTTLVSNIDNAQFCTKEEADLIPSSNYLYMKASCDVSSVNKCYNPDENIYIKSSASAPPIVESQEICDRIAQSYSNGAQLTGTLIPFDSTCEQVGSIENGNSGNHDYDEEYDVSGENSELADELEAYDNFYSPVEKERAQLRCDEPGFPANLFFSNVSCNLVEKCFYEPYKFGEIGFGFKNKESLGGIIDNPETNEKLFIEGFESLEDFYSCKSLNSIDSCFDYKSKKSCEENIVGNYLKNVLGIMNTELRDCVWIENKDFFNRDGFSKSGGICISNFTGKTKFYNYLSYSKSGNLLKNPSFEENDNNWTLSLSSFENDEWAYDGKRVLKLEIGGNASQTINYIDPTLSYEVGMYIKVDNFSENDLLNLEIKEYDENGDFINSSQFSWNLQQTHVSENGEYYKKFILRNSVNSDNSRQINLNSSTTSISFIISNGAQKNLYLDAVFFLSRTSGNVITINNNELFFSNDFEKPVSASNCEKCYLGLGLNDCTFEKSNLLGSCYYSVSDLDKYYGENLIGTTLINKYTGKNDNFFLNEWKAQSIPNSLLFCEMYLNESECVDANNFVNSKYTKLHPFAGPTLCKWDDNIGCYRDSLNAGVPSIFFTNETLVNTILSGSLSNDFDNYYDYESDFNSPSFSNFAYSCDMTPPTSYFYVSLLNETKDKVYVFNITEENKVYGRPKYHFEAFDKINSQCTQIVDYCQKLGLEGCHNFDFNHEIYIWINSSGTNWKYNLTKLNNYIYIDDSDNDATLESVIPGLKEGINKFTIGVSDQSGNFKFIRDFKLNLDLMPPLVNFSKVNSDGSLDLIDLGELENEDDCEVDKCFEGSGASFFFQGQNLQINVSDYSKINNCNYSLEPVSNVDSNYYNSSIFKLSENPILLSNYSKLVNMSDLIYNTSISGDSYFLHMYCNDIFNYKSYYRILLYVDYKTEFDLIYPNPFILPEINEGFLNNSPITFYAYSSETLGLTCNLRVVNNPSGNTINGDVDVLPSDFIGPNGVAYKKNITFDISNPSNVFKRGYNNVSIYCIDSGGSSFTSNYNFFYDPLEPSVLNLSLNETNVYTASDGKVYTTVENPKVYAKINGTHSWIKNLFNVSLVVGTDSNSLEGETNVLSYVINETYNLSSETFDFIGEMKLRTNFNHLTGTSYSTSVNGNLYFRNLTYTFYDKANNEVSEEFSYYYDNSNPSFNFTSDEAILHNGKLFVSNVDPNIIFNLNTPDYRKWNCNYTLNNYKLDQFGTDSFGPYFLGSNTNFNFYLFNQGGEDLNGHNLSDNINSGNPILNLRCIDVYGNIMEDDFEIVLDNTPPSLSLSAVNSTYYRKIDISNPIPFSTEFLLDVNSNEIYLNCTYDFIDYDNGIDCENPSNPNDFSHYDTSGGTFGPFDILFTSNSVCNEVSIPSSYEERKIGFNLTCRDLMDLESSQVYNLTIFYFDNLLKNLTFNYSNPNIIGVNLDSFVDLNNENRYIYLSNKSNLQNDSDPNIWLRFNNFEIIDGENFFRSFGSLTKSNYEEGLYTVYGLSYYSTDNIFTQNDEKEYINRSLYIDFTAPNISIDLIDSLSSEEYGEMLYGDRFKIRFNVTDNLHGLKRIEVYLKEGNSDFVKLYSADNISNTNDAYNVTIPDLIPGINNEDFKGNLEYEGEFSVNNITMDSYYTIKIVSEDLSSNIKEETKTFYLKDGLMIFLKDSENSFVSTSDNSYLFTREVAPIINISTSADSTECKIMPFFDIGQSNDYEMNKANERSFNYDLSSLSDFNLESTFAGYSANITLKCLYNGNYIYKSFTIIKIDYLPDYILKPLNSTSLDSIRLFFDYKVEIENKRDFPSIKCEYNINNIGYEEFESDYFLNSKVFGLNLTSYIDSSQDINVKYKCKDKTGVYGLEKSLTLYNNLNEPFNITNIKFIGKDTSNVYNVYEVDGEKNVYIQDENIDIIFTTNKNSLDYICEYNLANSGTLSQIISFIQDLFFDIGYIRISEDDNDLSMYKIENLDLDNGDTIIIHCNNPNDNFDPYEETIFVNVLSGEEFDYNLRMLN